MPTPLIIQANDGRLYRVIDAGEGLEHVWSAVPVKRVGARYVACANAQERLIRRAFCRVVEA